MRRLLILTIFFLVVPRVALVGQSRIPDFGPSYFGSSFMVGSNPRVQVFVGDRFHHTFFPPRSPFVFHHPIGFAQPLFVPVPVYNEPSQPVVVQTAPVAQSNGQQELQNEINSLRDEISRLREDRLRDEIERLKEGQRRLEPRDRRQRPPTSEEESAAEPRSEFQSQSATTDQGSAIILVFRDGRRLRVRDYAVVGQTFWDFSEDRARKIPLSRIDFDATTQVNEERGIDFRLP
jgi:hypothetical protein